MPDWYRCDHESVGRAPVDQLNDVYRALLDLLPLERHHYRNLRDRGLSREDIENRRYRSLPRRGRQGIAERIHRLHEEVLTFHGELCRLERGKRPLLRMPGFYQEDGVLTIAGASGMVVPVCDQNARIVALKVRADDPGDAGKYTYLSSRKYGGPGPGSPVHFPPYYGADHVSIRLTEGELKSDIACALTGVYTLGLPGVAVWRPAVDWLLGGGPTIHEKVLLAFDNDCSSNPNVARALSNCVRELVSYEFNVSIERW